MPLVQQPHHAPKRRRLQAPFNFNIGSQAPCTTEGLEGVMKELRQDVKAALVKQTEILIDILGVLQERNTKD
jgi:hypothetical protein